MCLNGRSLLQLAARFCVCKVHSLHAANVCFAAASLLSAVEKTNKKKTVFAGAKSTLQPRVSAASKTESKSATTKRNAWPQDYSFASAKYLSLKKQNKNEVQLYCCAVSLHIRWPVRLRGKVKKSGLWTLSFDFVAHT